MLYKKVNDYVVKGVNSVMCWGCFCNNCLVNCIIIFKLLVVCNIVV